MNTGPAARVSSITPLPGGRSTPRARAPRTGPTTAARDDLRQISSEGCLLSASHRPGSRRDLRALNAVESSRPASAARLDEVEPKLVDDIRCRPSPATSKNPRRNGAAETTAQRMTSGVVASASEAPPNERAATRASQDSLREHE